MKVVIFASDLVGAESVRFLARSGPSLAGVVLDERDKGGRNESIILDLERDAPTTPIFYTEGSAAEDLALQLRALDADIFLLAWWPYIVRKNIIAIPKIGALNFHPSLLPYNRGSNYNFWTIVEDTPFGVTIHWVDEGVDTGDIAFQSSIAKTWEDTGATLYAKAGQAMIELFRQAWPQIESGSIPRVPQNAEIGSSHRRSELEKASEIDLGREYPAADLLNILRARTFPPYPGAWFHADGGIKFEVRIEIRRVDRK